MNKKKTTRIVWASLLLGVAIIAISARSKHIVVSDMSAQRQFLENSQQLTLFSLDPAPLGASPMEPSGETAEQRKSRETPAAKDNFHGCRILGQVEITNSATKAKLLDALYKGVRKEGGWGAMCFFPRHGIRAKSGFTTVDLNICFECSTIAVSSGLSADRIFTTGTAQKVFDSTLVAAKVPLGSRPKRD